MQRNNFLSFDYVVIGAGCAGLSLTTRMTADPILKSKKILLIDKELKNQNDRTWCFWETGPGFFDQLVFKKWNKLVFQSDRFSDVMDISPYVYKMIRGIDFYRYCFERLENQGRVDIMYGNIHGITIDKKAVVLHIDDHDINLRPETIIFNSVDFPSKSNGSSNDLWQHFKGWWLETDKSFFNDTVRTLMDFRPWQLYGHTFAYVLPLDDRRALVEYTLFSKDLLAQHQYDEGLRHYVENWLGLRQYKITCEEFGKIPMTAKKFSWSRNGMFYIGTAGGQTKASTGYTFNFVQKQSEAIINCLANNRPLNSLSSTPSRFRFYDAVLLNILHNNKLNADRIFSDLFKKNKPQQLFKFLDNETGFANELKIIRSLPICPFLKAGIREFPVAIGVR
jgi:lycopene beta-cyclase